MAFEDLPLGAPTQHPDRFDSSLLRRIARSDGRARHGVPVALPFRGLDIWNCYELSWLDQRGVPKVAIAEISYPCDSPYLVESKSLKLFLGSFNNTPFEGESDRAQRRRVVEAITRELGRLLETVRCHARIFAPAEWDSRSPVPVPGTCVDRQDVSIDTYLPDASLLAAGEDRIEEMLYSNLMRSLCPVTGQPDWATVHVHYAGRRLRQPSLLKYLVSYRNHQGFHEDCCEKIFCDLQAVTEAARLCVSCFFLRRGGIDINPVRHTPGYEREPLIWRTARQ